ncbi:class C sortase [Tuanshanicoccus lijuaniae]|uniref:class C sortase n=1 Tax=Aerococcaceae bacterium zg-1292 TaxID=2774330 RepID=UPI00385CAA41
MYLKKQDLTTKLLIVSLVVGLGLIAYPTVANWWNAFHQSRAIMDYETAISQMSNEKYQQLLNEAKAYNQQISEQGINWVLSDAERDRYNKILNVDGHGNMGYISIPKIKVNLPLYHGVSEAVLQSAIGHIEGSSLPVGGQTSHSIVSGHRGLPSSRLFTDLDRLQVGDRWTVSILNETHTYEVDQIKTVTPNDFQFLQLEPDQDLMTLVTCTPYGVNTHRLLIRGHRVENENGNAMVVAEAIQIRAIFIAPFLALPLLIILFIGFLSLSKKRQARRIAEQRVRKRLNQNQ